jgi:DNA-directed RNA polymerase II subunit RPB1
MKAMEDVMVKYDGTVRTSKEHIIQFIYGEDGVSGEHVEDMSIDIMKMDDN